MTASESLEIYGEVYSSLSTLSSFCKLERKTPAGCDGVPFSTIITNLLLSSVSGKIAEARRRINEEEEELEK